MLLRFLGLALVSGWLAGCWLDDGAGSPDAGGPLYVLEVDPGAPLALAHGEPGEVWVRARDLDGEAVAGLTITFLLEGTPKDSGLSSVTAVTDVDGVAGTTVTAGYSNALFRVRASTDDAEPVFRSVAVSAGGFGSLAVTGTYAGERALGPYVLTLYFESTCKDTRVVEWLVGDRTIELAAGTAEGTFELLPASSTYAVVVTALYAGGVPFARGCADGLTVPADGSATLALEALDVPYISEGDYEGKLSVDFTAAAAALAEAAEAGGAAQISAAGSDAAFLLDAVAPASAEFASARTLDGLDAALETALGGAGSGPTEALALAKAGLLAELGPAELFGVLSIAPRDAGGERLAFAPEGLAFVPDGGAPITVGLDEAGIDVVTVAASIVDALDASAGVGFFFGLSMDELGRSALRAAALRAGASSVSEWLGAAAGCIELDAVIASSADASAACDAACVEAACALAVDELAAAMETGIAQGAAYSGISALGTMTLADLDDDLVIDAIGTALSCELVNGISNLAVPGTFEATRTLAVAPP